MQSYVVRSKIDKTGEKEIIRYYGVPVLSGQTTEEDLSKEICQMSSLTEADVLGSISSISRLMAVSLTRGDSVRIKGIGTFYVSATSEGVDTAEECTPAKVKAQRICFKADNSLRRVLEEIKYKKVDRRKARG